MEEAADSGGGQALDHASVAPLRSSFLSDNSAAHEGRKTQRSFSFSQSSGFLSRNSSQDVAGKFSASGFANWAKGLRITPNSAQEEPPVGDASKSPLSLFTNGFKKRSPAKIPVVDSPLESPPHSPVPQDGALGSFTKGFLDTSRNAMKAVQTKARHLVSQNKRRYQEGGFDLDMAYITENIIAMGFPAGDMSSGIFGYVEGFYRNHMEEVISFFESHHKGKYKVYNLCSERLYDASLFEGKVACFPFDDHNCPPLQLVGAFCQSAYLWLKGDLENVVVVHCKAGMARTGLMISSFLLYLKFFPTAEESISYYNQKRCVDGKGLVLPSQVRYVKYFERVLRNCDGETPIGRKVILRGFRLHKCPYWVRPSITVSNHNGILFSSKKHPRTKDMMPEDIWFNAPRKGILVFALPGERGLADLNGDFKVQFQDRHGDFYCWLNTNMMENRTMLSSMELDGFDKRRLPSPGFQVEIVILDHDASVFSKPKVETSINSTPSLQGPMLAAASRVPGKDSENSQNAEPGEQEKDDLFSDSENEDNGSKSKAHRSEKVVPGQDFKEGRTSQSITEGDAATSASGALASGLGNSIERMKISHGDDEDMPSHQVTSGGKGMDEKDHTSTFKETQRRSEGSREELAAENVRAEEHEHSFKIDSGQSNTAVPPSDFKAIAAASAADASVFTFGDEEDYESEED